MNNTKTIDIYEGFNESVPLPFGKTEVILASSTIFPLFFFGIFANVATMTGVLHSQALRSSLYYLLMSLCVSDFISALISPFALYRITWGYEYWYWSDGLCKIFWGADLITSIVTPLHILMFSFIRFVSVQWPQKFQIFTLRRTKIFITTVWIGGMVTLFIPMALFVGVIKRDRKNPATISQLASCSLLPDKVDKATPYAKIVYAVWLYTPILLTMVCSIALSIRIIVARRYREKFFGRQYRRYKIELKRRKKEQKILLQLLLIIGSFLVGYVPRSAYHLYIVTLPPIVGSGNYNWWFAFTEYLLLRVSESLNPVFYNLSSKKMRTATIDVLRVAWRKISRR